MCDDAQSLIGISGFARGKKLRGLRNHFHHGSWSTAIQASAGAVLSCIARPSLLSEAIGQAFGPLGAGRLTNRIKPSSVVRFEEKQSVLEFKPRQTEIPARRAA